MKDYRAELKIKNNRLLKRIEELGFASVRAFCTAFGLNYSLTINLICMSKPAHRSNGAPSRTVSELAAALSCNVEDLFNDRQWSANFKTTKTTLEVDDPFLSLDECTNLSLPSPHEDLEMRDLVARGLQGLTDREKYVLASLYGLDGPEQTLDDVGEVLRVTKERVRQIEAKAFRKIKHPSRLGADAFRPV